VALVVLAGLLWSAISLAIRHIEAGTWAVLFWRSAGMVPVLLAYVAWTSGGRVVSLVRRMGWIGAVGGFGLVFAFAGGIYAIQATTVANAAFLFAASPFMTAVLGWLVLRERVRRATWAAIALAGVGMVIMLREGLAAGAMAGNVAALLSALGFSAFTVTLRWGKLEDMMPAVVLGGVFSMLVAGAVLVAQGGVVWVSGRDIVIAMAMGAGLLGLGLALYTLGSKVVPAAEMSLLSMVEVMFAPVWVFLALGETASPATFVGGAVVMAAITVNALSGMRRPAATSTFGP
jgi:drug/metabolite transporter (DMT)-like permease